MVDPVNLRQFRKRKAREEKAQQAEANRKLHGISSKLRKQVKQQNEAAIARLDGKRLKSDD